MGTLMLGEIGVLMEMSSNRECAVLLITIGGTIPKNHESIIEPLMELRIDHHDIDVL